MIKAPFLILIIYLLMVPFATIAQLQWTDDGNGIYQFSEDNGIQVYDIRSKKITDTFLPAALLIPQGASKPLQVQSFQVSSDKSKILLFTNTKRVWRENTRGDYWVYNVHNKSLKQLGNGLPPSSLKFAKFSPDGKMAAYVSLNNIYIEDLSTMDYYAFTTDGSHHLINGTFDWAYEEEFGTKDGFRWSPDGNKIAYWKQDAKDTRNFLMINNTDSLYAFTIPVEYPKVGLPPSATSIWFYDLASKTNHPATIAGDPSQHYIPRMEWMPDAKAVILQQLNRKQTESKIIITSATTGTSTIIHTETDSVWIDIKARWNNGDPSGWDWINGGKEFIWVSEKDKYRKIYAIDSNGKERLITRDDFDVIEINFIDAKNKKIYFSASPDNATQKYLYAININGAGIQRITPPTFTGTNTYTISPNGAIALFNHSSTKKSAYGAVINLPAHTELHRANQTYTNEGQNQTEFFTITTIDDIELDGWMVKPKNFDPNKKYPIVFMVYGEPAMQTVTDNFNAGKNRLYKGDMAEDGYIYISLENRGTPTPKGRAWRKSIYKNIGIINIRDQAMGAKEILKWSFVDASRVAVWGWSGGGASTLNLLGQYPEIYQTGIAIAPVTNQLLYDNIYQERYMGLPQEDTNPFTKGSAITYAKNVRGNLLLIHGTGDDNVHYQNAEVYINELIKHNIPFQMMAYPNRSHSINEGEGTGQHLQTIFTNFLKQYCPPGGR